MTTLAKVYDAIVVANLPTDGDGYLAYLNGKWKTVAGVQQRFPGKPLKTVSVTGETSGEALTANLFDCEFGDYNEITSAAAAHNKISAGLGRPTIYSSTGADSPLDEGSMYLAIRTQLRALGLDWGTDVDWLEANYSAGPSIADVPGAIGRQYLSTTGYDESLVLASWLIPGSSDFFDGGCQVGIAARCSRPEELGGGTDFVCIGLDDLVHLQGNQPNYKPGDLDPIEPQPPARNFEITGVTCGWVKDSGSWLMEVGVLYSDGTYFINNWDPTTWKFGAVWAEMAIWVA